MFSMIKLAAGGSYIVSVVLMSYMNFGEVAVWESKSLQKPSDVTDWSSFDGVTWFPPFHMFEELPPLVQVVAETVPFACNTSCDFWGSLASAR